jgi:hypothetical protein
MKLVEILARDVKEWLDCWVSAVQDSDGTVWFNLEDNVGPIFDADRSWVSNPCHSEMFNVSSDFQTAIVTRAQWEAERARMAMDCVSAFSQEQDQAEQAVSQYDQELWDKVASKTLEQLISIELGSPTETPFDLHALVACRIADAFMAERAKRLKGSQ